MQWNSHWELRDRHAFLSPSQHAWVNYSLEKLEVRYFNDQAKKRGTLLHEFASQAIKLNRKLPRNKDSVNCFVNDALGYGMQSEQPLYYSDNCFGTADAISFNKGLLRIHDLKTGISSASMMQLIVYAALFCLEYGVDPKKIDMELRIYQNDEIEVLIPDPDEVQEIMDTIIEFDKRIEFFKSK